MTRSKGTDSWSELRVRLLVLIGSALLRRRTLREDRARVLADGNGDVKPADHHLFPTLLAPRDFLGGVRVSLVSGGVIEVRGALQLGSLRQVPLLGQVVEE